MKNELKIMKQVEGIIKKEGYKTRMRIEKEAIILRARSKERKNIYIIRKGMSYPIIKSIRV